jgi:hypothetical protein
VSDPGPHSDAQRGVNSFLCAESWDNIIDLKTKHQFPVETNFPVAQQFVASLRVQKKEGDIKGSGAGRADRRYMSSQYFADSSLSQDVSQSSFFGGAEENQDSQTNEEVIHVPDKAQVKTVEADAAASSEGKYHHSWRPGKAFGCGD